MPPEHHTNKDWWKALLKDDKKAFKMSEVKCITIPRIDELSVKVLFDMTSNDENIKVYLPFCYYEKTKCDRQFLLNIINTVYPKFL